MLALKAIIHNYRSIQEECTLNIEPLVTTLVGATESGKSNILKALASFTSGAYTEDDFCSRSAERSTLDPNARMVTVEFRIEDHDRDALTSYISSARKGGHSHRNTLLRRPLRNRPTAEGGRPN